ncbi:MAG: GntR family transcriptional regulator [Monoglobales bacterium]
MINLDYKDGRSLYEQIEAGIRGLIIGGILKPEDKLPSVRELSVTLTVNPNTVQKAYKLLENNGFIYSVKAKGNFVAPFDKGESKRGKELYDNLKSIVKELVFIGEEKAAVEKVIAEIYSEKEESK